MTIWRDQLALHTLDMEWGRPLGRVCSFAYSIWLFTFSDLKTIVLPTSFFGIINAIAATVFGIEGIISTPGSISLISVRTLAVICWVWINLLPFAINNQRQPEAIAEDVINKPWRPLPSGRLTPIEAKRIMFMFYVLAVGGSLFLGGLKQCLAGIMLGFWYNVLRGSDRSFVTRNFINALGFLGFTSGALEVALARPLWWNSALASWFALVATVVFSTIHTQDMCDQAGDAARKRKTVPIVIGDVATRQLLAVTMVFWGFVCPWFWSLPLLVHKVFLLLSSMIAYRYLTKRTQRDDKITFRLWNVWMALLYSLPFLSYIIA